MQQHQQQQQQQQQQMLQETPDYSTLERDIKEYVKDRRLQAIDFRDKC
jgi:hypothetical protein